MTRSFRILLSAFAAAFALAGASSASAGSITLSDPNCASFTLSGTAGNQTLTCVTGGGGPNPPTGCVASIVTNPTTLTNAGGTATVSVAGCSATGVLTYSWSRNGLSGWSTSATPPADQLAAGGTSGSTTSYQVQVCNDGSSCVYVPGNPLTAFVPGTGGGGGAGIDLTGCTAAGYTGRGLDVAFPATATTSKASGTFGNNDALVVRFTTPAAGVNDQTVFQPAGMAPSQNTSRVYTLSTQPCQFTTDGSLTGSILYTVSSQSPAITINIGACPYTGSWCSSAAYLQPNTTYYVTMVNRTTFGGAPSCSFASCDMRMDFNK